MNTELIKQQHENNYRNAIIENIKNNTEVLVFQELLSLLKKPPLDSMDVLKSKFIELAKNNKIVLNTEELSNMLDKYRESLISCCSDISKIRIDELCNKIDCFDFSKNNLVKFNKKDFVPINKKIQDLIKSKIKDSYQINIVIAINSIFDSSVDSDIKRKIINEFESYVEGNYQTQLLDNINSKILIKDNTLINVVKEQGDRYLFTIKNSKLFQQF